MLVHKYAMLGGKKEMADSVYKVIELVGTSTESWEKAVQFAVTTAAQTLHDLRIAEVEKLDVQIENGRIVQYRAKIKLSFKYHEDE
jgi:dodecin